MSVTQYSKTHASTHASTTKDDILQYLLKQREATAQELAEVLAVSPQAVRRHLKDLAEENLICHEVVPAKMGRPQHVYQLSRGGRARFPGNYDQFAVSLLHTLSETVPPDQFCDIIKTQWQKKIAEYRSQLREGPLRSRLEQLVALRRSEGFMSEVHDVQDLLRDADEAPALGMSDDRQQFVVTEYNCAIAEVAASFPSVCGHELELFSSLLPDCRVERTHWMIRGENYCGYLIQSH